MARPRKPILLHKIEGTGRPGRIAARANELRIEGETPEAPAWLLPEALEEWTRITTNTRYSGALAHVDRALLTIYCQEWAHYMRGETGTGRQMGSEKLKSLIQIAAKFGFSPVDRGRVTLAKKEQKAADPWAALG